MTREEAIATLEESKRQNKIMIDNPTTFWTSHQMADGVKNAKRRIEALDHALSALRPVSREQAEKVWPECPYCKEDGEGYVQKFGAYSIQNGELATGHCKSQKIKFCPHCSRPLTDEAVEMVLERLEAMKNGSTTD